METRHQDAIENRNKDLLAVQALELKMEITNRWILGDALCHETVQLLYMHKYQRALNVLEGLVVAWVFELSKLNRSQTGQFYFNVLYHALLTSGSLGYCLCKHIGEALQKRSAAI